MAAQPWTTIKGGGASTPDPTRQAQSTKARKGPRAPRHLGWTRTPAQRQWARRLELISLTSVILMALAGVVGLVWPDGEGFGTYWIAAIVALVVVHPIAFLADTLSNSESRMAGWCVIAFWTMFLGVPLLIGGISALLAP